jgi:hypothetical protein
MVFILPTHEVLVTAFCVTIFCLSFMSFIFVPRVCNTSLDIVCVRLGVILVTALSTHVKPSSRWYTGCVDLYLKK